jgi:hypothetical protein
MNKSMIAPSRLDLLVWAMELLGPSTALPVVFCAGDMHMHMALIAGS